MPWQRYVCSIPIPFLALYLHPLTHIYIYSHTHIYTLSHTQVFGSNKLEDLPPESWLSIFLGSFNDATLIVLIVSACVSLVIGQ
jgi:hypothetical protein